MAAVIKIVKRNDDAPCPEAGQYVVMFDHDANFGHGQGEFKADRDYALRFPDKAAAEAFVQRAGRWRPTRPETGEPNQPLAAYAVTIEEVP